MEKRANQQDEENDDYEDDGYDGTSGAADFSNRFGSLTVNQDMIRNGNNH